MHPLSEKTSKRRKKVEFAKGKRRVEDGDGEYPGDHGSVEDSSSESETGGTHDTGIREDPYAYEFIPNLRVKAMPNMMMEGQVPLIYVLYI